MRNRKKQRIKTKNIKIEPEMGKKECWGCSTVCKVLAHKRESLRSIPSIHLLKETGMQCLPIISAVGSNSLGRFGQTASLYCDLQKQKGSYLKR